MILAADVSNDEIDEIYKQAWTYGALGGKICGSGGGGFLLLYCPGDSHMTMRKEIKRISPYREFPFRIEQRGSRIIFSQ